MTLWAESLDQAARPGTARRWIGAGLVVGTVYAAGLLWALDHPVAPGAPATAPAVMVELAPLPVAADTSQTRQGRDQRSAPQVSGTIASPAPPPKPDAQPQLPQAEATSRPDTPVPAMRPVPPTPPAPVAEQTAPPPPPAPPRARPVQTAKPAPVRQTRHKAQPASRAAEKASAKVRQSTRTAAPRASAGTRPSAQATAQWQARLQAHLAHYKQYPADARARGETGTVLVRFRLDARGQVLSVRILRSSGHPDLDAAVLRMVRRAAPMPAPPSGSDPTITAPISFSLR